MNAAALGTGAPPKSLKVRDTARVPAPDYAMCPSLLLESLSTIEPQWLNGPLTVDEWYRIVIPFRGSWWML